MKTSKILFVIAAMIGATVAFAAEEKKSAAPHAAKCCVKAEKDGKTCSHECCVAAAKDGKNCEKCGGAGAMEAKK